MRQFILCLAMPLWLVPARAAPPAVTLRCDLDGDGRSERLTLDPRRDPALTVRRGGRVLWRGIPQRWKPWKLVVAEVDGNPGREIAVGVRKATRFFPETHNCLFVYGWDGRRAFPRWLGSRLGRPFIDFAFADLDGDGRDELVAVESTQTGQQGIAVYTWTGFGFRSGRREGEWRSAKIVGATRNAVTVRVDGGRLLTVR